MSQFLDRDYFGYTVVIRPDDWLRKWFRFRPLNLEIIPYFSGSDISVRMKVENKKNINPSELIYEWRLYNKVDPVVWTGITQG